MTTLPDLEHRFTYHAPRTPGVVRAHERVRELHLRLAQEMDELLPDGREKSLVITQLEQSMFWANAAIARSVKGEPPAHEGYYVDDE